MIRHDHSSHPDRFFSCNKPIMLSTTEYDGRLAAMIDVARAAGRHTLRYFQSGELTVDAKADDSPVTVADRQAEQLTRERLAEKYPDDTVQGEEFDTTEGGSPYRWIVDPIDGTKSFVCGVPLYSTLLALEWKDQSLGGVIYLPALGEIVVAAKNQGCWYARGLATNGEEHVSTPELPWRAAKVSEKRELETSVFVNSQVDSFGMRGSGDVYRQLEKACWITRTWGDGYGYLMVATGRAEIMIDPECNAWDVAAILPILEEAGGRFTDWTGNATTRGGEGVGTNGLVHDTVLRLLKP